jgi:hypothetical protein
VDGPTARAGEPIATKEHVLLDAPKAGQCFEGFFARTFSGLLIHQRDRAPVAGFDQMEQVPVDAQRVPMILRKGLGSCNHNVGPKAIYRQRGGQARVECIERRLAQQMKGIAIGKADNLLCKDQDGFVILVYSIRFMRLFCWRVLW